MKQIENIRKTRIEKLENFRKAGINPYPAKVPSHKKIGEVLINFKKLEAKKVAVAGRIRSIREHGGSTFSHIEDGTGKIQLFLNRKKIGKDSYKFFLHNFDVGDFVLIKGKSFKTKKGEKTIEVQDYKILAKSLLQLPEKWHGLQDIEERFRKRYLDLLMTEGIKEKFVLRSKIIKELRSFMEKEGFVEVETPILQPMYGGAAAKPFTTHLNALDMDLYLRIAPELYLKRLIVGGFEKVFEIGKAFRNEGVDRSHNPDFTIFEFYWAYADDDDVMKLAEKMFGSVVKNLFGKLEIEYQGKKINFKAPWPKIEYAKLIRKFAKVDIEKTNKEDLLKKAKELEVKVNPKEPKEKIEDAIYKKFCLPKLWEPTFVIHHPTGTMPLAKELDEDSLKLGSIQLVIAGFELVKAYSELNNPIKQREAFQEQEKLFVEGIEDAQRVDEDYLEAMEYGMPPLGGFGIGIDRLVTLLTDSKTLREAILFPLMKEKK